MRILLFGALATGICWPDSIGRANDVIFFLRGEKYAGQVIEIEGSHVRVRKFLPPPPSALPEDPPLFASVAIPRPEIARIEFAPDAERERILATASVAQLGEIESLWRKASRWLAMPRSPAGRIGLRYAELLLASGAALAAFDLFVAIESQAWNSADALLAKQGRLRAMAATGKAQAAVAEARELAKVSQDPEVVVEARHILAVAAEQVWRDFLAEHPRWKEDPHAVAEGTRLQDEVLDLYLHPALFFGSDSAAAARGLWGAAAIYRLGGDLAQAAAVSRDIISLHPQEPSARQAREFLESLPKELQEQTQ